MSYRKNSNSNFQPKRPVTPMQQRAFSHKPPQQFTPKIEPTTKPQEKTEKTETEEEE